MFNAPLTIYICEISYRPLLLAVPSCVSCVVLLHSYSIISGTFQSHSGGAGDGGGASKGNQRDNRQPLLTAEAAGGSRQSRGVHLFCADDGFALMMCLNSIAVMVSHSKPLSRAGKV